MSVFSERLKEIMDERGITQVTLSEMTDIPKSAICQYLSDRFKPRQDRTYVICRALDTDPAWLMGLSDTKCPFEHDLRKETLTGDEFRLVSYYRKHPEVREFLMGLVENEQSCTAVFRAAKSKDGSIAPVCEVLSAERIKRLLEAPETQEDV